MEPVTTSKIAKLGILAVTIILALALLEGGSRFYLARYYQASDVTEKNALVGHTYKKNLDKEIVIEGNHGFVRLVTNQYGFIGPSWPETKETGTVRIAHLGDSFTAGVNAPYKENYASLVGDALSKAIHSKVESLNFGVEGYGTGDELKVYSAYVRNFKPDIVIVWWYSGNDFSDNQRTAGADARVATSVVSSLKGFDTSFSVKNLASRSGLWRLFKLAAAKSGLATAGYNALKFIPGMKKIADQSKDAWHGSFITPELRPFTSDDPVEFSRLAETTKLYFEELQRVTAQDGARLFVVIVPTEMEIIPADWKIVNDQYPTYHFDKHQVDETVNMILSDLGVAHHDLTDDFMRGCTEGSCPIWQCQFCHLSQEGHSFVSKRVTPVLHKWYLNESI